MYAVIGGPSIKRLSADLYLRPHLPLVLPSGERRFVIMTSAGVNEQPFFTAVSGSARQLFQLLKCINFAQKAQVRITEEGLRFTVEESRVIQGSLI